MSFTKWDVLIQCFDNNGGSHFGPNTESVHLSHGNNSHSGLIGRTLAFYLTLFIEVFAQWNPMLQFLSFQTFLMVMQKKKNFGVVFYPFNYTWLSFKSYELDQFFHGISIITVSYITTLIENGIYICSLIFLVNHIYEEKYIKVQSIITFFIIYPQSGKCACVW